MNLHPVRPEGAAGGVHAEGALRRLLPLLVPVAAAGAAALLAAAVDLATARPSLATLAGLFVLLAAALLAEAYPVPVESLPAGYVSLAAVFVVGAAVLFGWAEAVLVAFVPRATLDLVQSRPLERLVYNGAVYALAGAAAGGAAVVTPGADGVGRLVLEVLFAAGAFYFVDVVLIVAVIARWAAEPFAPLLRMSAYWTILPFAIMASGSLMLAVLWERNPMLSVALLGPLLAIALYQRSVHSALVATRLALTDALTGLGNQRHFHERLQQELDGADAGSRALTLCLLDVDDLKGVNDTYGHPVGDRLLEQVASCLRHGGEAFRLGGDEFGLLLPMRSEADSLEAAKAVMRRLSAVEFVEGQRLRISAGLATYPTYCPARHDLYRAADEALYKSKRERRNAVHVFRPDPQPELKAG